MRYGRLGKLTLADCRVWFVHKQAAKVLCTDTVHRAKVLCTGTVKVKVLCTGGDWSG